MTLLLLAILAAEPAASAPPAPEPEKIEVPAVPAVPKADVPDEIMKSGDAEPDIGWTLFRTLIVLGMTVMLAYVSLNWGLRKFLGIRPAAYGANLVSVLERVPLDQRRSLFVVKAANEYLLVGGAESSLSLISKLDTAEVERLRAEVKPPIQLSPFLEKLLKKKGTGTK